MSNEPKQSYDDRMKIISEAVNETQNTVVISEDVQMEDVFNQDDFNEIFEVEL